MIMAGMQTPAIPPSKGTPTVTYRKEYMKGVLKLYETDKRFEEAYKECQDLLSVKNLGPTPGPVIPFKEENVTEEQRKYKPKLAEILQKACKSREKNSSLAWREYIDNIEYHKVAQEIQKNNPPSSEGQEQSVEELSAKEVHEERNSAQVAVSDVISVNNEQGLTLFELLSKEENKDSDEYEEAYQDLVHMFTCHAVLRSSFPQANILLHMTVNIKNPEDMPETARERNLYKYLTNLKQEAYGGYYSDIWREYGTLLIAENLLELARKANGPDQNIYLVVKKIQFYEMQRELQSKTDEIEELSKSKCIVKSQTKCANIADMSDIERPLRLGEMYSQLFDDEWTDAFQAFKDNMLNEKDIYPVLLSLLQEAFKCCRETSSRLLQDLETKLKDTLKQVLEPRTDQSVHRRHVNDVMHTKVYKGRYIVEKHYEELKEIASLETAKHQTRNFIKERLPEILTDDKVRQDSRVISYVQKCVELCWFMNVQDPPMELVIPKEGDPMDKNLFKTLRNKGSVVQTNVWAALLLYKDGPSVCKGYVIPM